jgi:hypothetical protein
MHQVLPKPSLNFQQSNNSGSSSLSKTVCSDWTAHIENDEPATLTTCQEAVGCLQWLAGGTRPDISYTASMLARYSNNPTEAHWGMALRATSYLAKTGKRGRELGGVNYLWQGGSMLTEPDVGIPGDQQRGTHSRSTDHHYLLLAPTTDNRIIDCGGGIHRNSRDGQRSYLA